MAHAVPVADGPRMDKLPDFFPLVVPQCKDDAAMFFKCFTKSAQTLDDKAEPVVGSLAECQGELQMYSKCMKAHYRAKEKKGKGRKKFLWIF